MRRALLTCVLVGCTTTTTTYPPTPADAGSPQDAGADRVDAALEDGCTPPPASLAIEASLSCSIEGACPTCGEAVLYRCNSRGGSPVPPGTWSSATPASPIPVHACGQLTNGIGGGPSDFCCPSVCVVAGDLSAACAGTPVLCPANYADPAPKGCTFAVTRPDGSTLLCCK